MATATANITVDNTTDASFRAWGSSVSAALAAVGLVQTTDTGQINWSTVTRPTSSVFQGYEVWRFADSLQSTKPVFIKVEYGATSGTTQPSLAITIGTSTNGAGTLTGTVSARDPFIIGPGGPSAVATPYYASGDTSSVGFIGTGVVTIGNLFTWGGGFFIERSRDANGAANGDGLVYTRFSSQLSNSPHQFMSFTNNSVSSAAATSYWPLPIPAKVGGSFNTGTDVTLFPLVVCTPKPQGPSLLVLGCYSSEFPRAVTQTVVIGGTAHTYLPITGTSLVGSVESNTPTYGFLMRYE